MRALAAHGAQVVGAARNLTKAEHATGQVRADAEHGGGTFELIALEPFWKFAMIGFQEVLSVIQMQDVDASTTRPHDRNYTQDETLSV
ncbi:hypothetical protein A4S02_05075 [Acetobacter ascendens]|uniref:Uncharacterized protein n=1 Tax=Acetobacter ascendens TaxID=481146 RepID=A0A1D8QVA2_9PROT|nr:hypothetical protein A4S02_05075 [Acetobacter ascendens]